jgi:hypothetical protein
MQDVNKALWQFEKVAAMYRSQACISGLQRHRNFIVQSNGKRGVHEQQVV